MFCNAHYEIYSYMYFININWLLCSYLTEIHFSSLTIQSLKADKYTFWAFPVDTTIGIAKSTLRPTSMTGKIVFQKAETLHANVNL